VSSVHESQVVDFLCEESGVIVEYLTDSIRTISEYTGLTMYEVAYIAVGVVVLVLLMQVCLFALCHCYRNNKCMWQTKENSKV
jgi:hypothetical protein